MFEISQLWVRIAGAAVFGILLLFFVNPLLLGIRNEGVYAGIVISVLGILYFSLNHLFGAKLDIAWKNDGFPRFLLCIAVGTVALAAALAIIFSICMGVAIADKPKEEQPVVILGCKVRGEQPSLMLKKRLDAALGYLNEHPDVQVIVCGGQGPDEKITEAACMADYLEKHGISRSRIREDRTSTSTYENLRNAKDILDEENWGHKIILVTDGYHQFRAGQVAKGLHLETDKVSAPTSWYLVPTYWLREWMGICHMFLFG
jgi:uncharacterized SAM-binding protein YcdF (DUF218 family)